MPKTSASTFMTLSDALRTAETVTDLFKLASSDDFRDGAKTLVPEDLSTLREEYRKRQSELDGKVRLQEFAGQVLVIVDIDYWYSDKWDNEGVTLHFHPESNPGKVYKALTSSSVVVRFARQFDRPPTKDQPVRALLGMKPVRDAERAARGQQQFTIKRLADKRIDSDGSPF